MAVPINTAINDGNGSEMDHNKRMEENAVLYKRLYSILDVLFLYFAKENYAGTLSNYFNHQSQTIIKENIDTPKKIDSGMDVDDKGLKVALVMNDINKGKIDENMMMNSWVSINYILSLKRISSITKNPYEVLSAAAILGNMFFNSSIDIQTILNSISLNGIPLEFPNDISIRPKALFSHSSVATAFLTSAIGNNTVLIVSGSNLDSNLTTTMEITNLFSQFGTIDYSENISTKTEVKFVLHFTENGSLINALTMANSSTGILIDGERLTVRCELTNDAKILINSTNNNNNDSFSKTVKINLQNKDDGNTDMISMDLEPDYSVNHNLKEEKPSIESLLINPNNIKVVLEFMPILNKIAEQAERNMAKDDSMKFPENRLLSFKVPRTSASLQMDFSNMTIKKFIDQYSSSVVRVDIIESNTITIEDKEKVFDSNSEKWLVRGIIKFKHSVAKEILSILLKEGIINGIKVDFELMSKEQEKIWWVIENKKLIEERQHNNNLLIEKDDWLSDTNIIKSKKFNNIPSIGKRANKRARTQKRNKKLLGNKGNNKNNNKNKNKTNNDSILRKIEPNRSSKIENKIKRTGKIENLLEDLVSGLESF